MALPSGAKDQQLILIGHPFVSHLAIQLQPLEDKGHEIKCDFIGRDGYFETARIAVETVSWKKSNCVWIWAMVLRDVCWLEDWQLKDSFYAGALQNLQTRYFKKSHPSLTRIRWSYPPEKENTLDVDPPKYLQSNLPTNMMHTPQIPCPNKNCPTIQSPGNDFGLWSAQLALPWWCPDPCCGMWRSLSATVDPQRSEIQDGRVVPWALWLGSSVVCVILVTYGFWWVLPFKVIRFMHDSIISSCKISDIYVYIISRLLYALWSTLMIMLFGELA